MIARVTTSLKDKFKVENIAPGHCTGEPTFAALKKAFGDRYLYAGLGTTLPLRANNGSDMPDQRAAPLRRMRSATTLACSGNIRRRGAGSVTRAGPSIAVALLLISSGASATECQSSPGHDGKWWSYRIVDSKRCWYQGRPGRSKDLLQWAKQSPQAFLVENSSCSQTS